ncbi:MAG: carboxypeptidase regulatory-like domain-containing protein [Candidatus Acidiferrales bacterium]
MQRVSFAALGLAAAICVAAIAPAAQRSSARGSLAGQVLGPDGKAVQGARILLQSADGRNPHTKLSDSQGRFRFPVVRAGLYDLRAQASGQWSPWEHNVLVRSGRQTEVTLRLLLKHPPPDPPAARAPLQGRVREWLVPTESSLPHDPAVDPQENVWLTLMGSNQVTRFNPETGEWKLFPAPTPNSGPHGLVADASGNIWYEEFAANQLVRFNPQTQTLHRFAMLSPRSEVRHVARDGRGRIWMALSGANKVAVVE